MSLSIFSFLMSILCCNILIIQNCILLRLKKIIFNIYTFLVIIIFCILRSVFCFELPNTYILHSRLLFPLLIKIINFKPLKSVNLTIGHILLVLWITGSIISLCKLIMSNIRFYRSLHCEEYNEICKSNPIFLILHKITDKNVKIFFSDSINSPMITGFFQPHIYLPQIPISEKELYYILLHEWNHYIYKDLWIKLVVEVLCCLYWWNPLVYLLKYDLNNILEIKNDYVITKRMDDHQKTEYLETLLKFIKLFGNKGYKKNFTNHLCLIYHGGSNIIEQRFRLILAPNTQKKVQKLLSCISCSFAILIYTLSFSFIIQPVFDAPTEESGIIIYDINPYTAYLIKNSDNTYHLFINDQYVDTITDINIEPFSTLVIKKGNQE